MKHIQSDSRQDTVLDVTHTVTRIKRAGISYLCGFLHTLMWEEMSYSSAQTVKASNKKNRNNLN